MAISLVFACGGRFVDDGESGLDAEPDVEPDTSTDVAFDVFAGDADADDGAPTIDGGDANIGCNNLQNGAPVVTEAVVPGPVPLAQGGSIVFGRYYMTAESSYLGVDAGDSPRRWTIVVSASDIESVFEDINASPAWESWTYGLYGTNIDVQIICPYQYAFSFRYTATPTQLRVYDGTVEQVFDLQ